MLQLKIKATDLTGLVYRELLDVQRNAEKAAGGVRELVKRHFDARGGKRYWGEAAESVEVAGSSKGVVVGIVLSLLAEEKPEDWEPRPQYPRPRPPWWRRWY